MAEEKNDLAKRFRSPKVWFEIIVVVLGFAGFSLLLNPSDGFLFIRLGNGWEDSAIYPWGSVALTLPLTVWWALTAIRSRNRWSLEYCVYFVVALVGLCLNGMGHKAGLILAAASLVVGCIRTLVFVMDGAFVPEEIPESEVPVNSPLATDSESTEPEDSPSSDSSDSTE